MGVTEARAELLRSGIKLDPFGVSRGVYLGDDGPVVGWVKDWHDAATILFQPLDDSPASSVNINYVVPVWIFRTEDIVTIMGWLKEPVPEDAFFKKAAKIRHQLFILQKRRLITRFEKDRRYFLCKSPLYEYVESVL